MPSFDQLRYRRADGSVFLYAFDLLELNGQDLRRDPLEVCKATLASVLTKAATGLRLSMTTAKLFSATPARWGWRALSRSGAARPTGPDGRATG